PCRCTLCRAWSWTMPSDPIGDAPCPNCGHLLSHDGWPGLRKSVELEPRVATFPAAELSGIAASDSGPARAAARSELRQVFPWPPMERGRRMVARVFQTFQSLR